MINLEASEDVTISKCGDMKAVSLRTKNDTGLKEAVVGQNKGSGIKELMTPSECEVEVHQATYKQD